MLKKGDVVMYTGEGEHNTPSMIGSVGCVLVTAAAGDTALVQWFVIADPERRSREFHWLCHNLTLVAEQKANEM